MRILQFANKFPYPARDGGSIATLSLARSLAQLGHEVTVLAINTSKHYSDPSLIPDDLARSVRFLAVPVDTDIRIIKLVRNFLISSLPYNAERFISKAVMDALLKLLKEEDFDVIQMEGLYLAPYLSLIRSKSEARIVMRAHNVEFEIWDRSASLQRGLKKWYFRHLAKRIKAMEIDYLNKYDAILPITRRDGTMLEKMGCRIPLHVVPTGIDADMLVPDHSRLDFPSLFHIGALDWIPNQEGLLWFFEKVWGKILEKHPELVFYLAGRNAPASFRNLPYPNIEFLGEVEDAYDFIRSKGVMIVPLLSGSGMRIKIVEGMALAKAIVTTSIGTEGIGTTHGNDILIADDPEAFASHVLSLIEDKVYCLKIGENARNFVISHFDNRTISLSLVEFYQGLSR
jgi:glycosyltransferase involved in cell wall biosynthesis